MIPISVNQKRGLFVIDNALFWLSDVDYKSGYSSTRDLKENIEFLIQALPHELTIYR